MLRSYRSQDPLSQKVRAVMQRKQIDLSNRSSQGPLSSKTNVSVLDNILLFIVVFSCVLFAFGIVRYSQIETRTDQLFQEILALEQQCKSNQR